MTSGRKKVTRLRCIKPVLTLASQLNGANTVMNGLFITFLAETVAMANNVLSVTTVDDVMSITINYITQQRWLVVVDESFNYTTPTLTIRYISSTHDEFFFSDKL